MASSIESDEKEYTESVKKVFNRRAEGYDTTDRWSEFHKAHADILISNSSIEAGHTVLDLMCGTGMAARRAAKLCRKVCGLDLSPKMILAARKATHEEGLTTARFEVCDVSSLTVDFLEKKGLPTKFDRILCVSALAYLIDPAGAIRRWAKFLSPGGKLCISGFGEEFDIRSHCINLAAEVCNIPQKYPNEATGDTHKCAMLLEQAGLCVSRVVWEEQLQLPESYTAKHLNSTFDKILKHPITMRWAGSLSDPEVAKLRSAFQKISEKKETEGKGKIMNNRKAVFFVGEAIATAASTEEGEKKHGEAAGSGYKVKKGHTVDGFARVSSGSTFESLASYSRAVVVGKQVHVSGTTGYDYSRMIIDPSAVVQAEQCFVNIAEALSIAGSHIDRVFRIRVHLASIGSNKNISI